jgi:hypothetical protein
MTNRNPNKVPIKNSVNLDEIAARLPSRPDPEITNLYAKLIGELMFVAIITQPLIAQPVNSLARFMTTANSELYTVAKGVLRYLKGRKSRKITCVPGLHAPTVRLREMETGISEASKRVPIFSFATQGRQASQFPFSTEELGPSPRGSDPVSCRLT